MRPIFKISGDGSDITSQINARLIELSIQDNAGMHNDRLSITLDDRQNDNAGFVEKPPSGTIYDVSLGYAQVPNQDCPAPLTFMGRFVQDEIEIQKSKRGRSMTINAHAADTGGTLKQPRDRSYHNKKLGDIVQECATRNGLQAVVQSDFQSIMVKHIDQIQESDASFLTRLYDLYGAIAKPYSGKLLFGAPDGIREMLGVTSNLEIDETTVLSYRYLEHSQGKFKKTKAHWIDKNKAKLETAVSKKHGN